MKQVRVHEDLLKTRTTRFLGKITYERDEKYSLRELNQRNEGDEVTVLVEWRDLRYEHIVEKGLFGSGIYSDDSDVLAG